MPRIVPSQVVQVIEYYFPQTKKQTNMRFEVDRGHRNECISIAKSLDQIPSELLSPPMAEDYVKLISNIAILNFTLELWKTVPKTSIDALSGRDQANPISIIHDILLKCPDEAISTNTTGLEFIDDVNFRDSLRLDLTSVNSALSNGEFKAATVLAGSIAEALLLWAINKVKPTELDAAKKKHLINPKGRVPRVLPVGE